MGPVQIYATCPQSRDVAREFYTQRVIDAAQWSEEAGCHGMLVYTDNGIADPWLVAQLLLQHTKALVPLVAVQPAYMSPFSAAKMVASLGWMHGRAVALNMVAGGFRNDLLALGDPTPHDERYERLIEYVAIIKALLADHGPVSLEGKHYRVRNLRMAPGLAAELMPDVLVSGSSAAGEAAAQTMGAISVTYPEPIRDDEQRAPDDGRVRGVRVGIIARETAEEAWDVAYERFPDTRAGRITHGLAMKVSDSRWHQQLSSLEEQPATPDHPYWLGPFQTSATFCPYLVGTYERVGDELARYVGLGASVFILDIPPSREELVHTGTAIRRAKTASKSSHAHASP